MRAQPIGLKGEHEDPHGVYDAQAGKWRLLLSERVGKCRAGMWESDRWDSGYKRLSGPVEMDRTGSLIQKIGGKRYALFGSAYRKVNVRTYPDLKPACDRNFDACRRWLDFQFPALAVRPLDIFAEFGVSGDF